MCVFIFSLNSFDCSCIEIEFHFWLFVVANRFSCILYMFSRKKVHNLLLTEQQPLSSSQRLTAWKSLSKCSKFEAHEVLIAHETSIWRNFCFFGQPLASDFLNKTVGGSLKMSGLNFVAFLKRFCHTAAGLRRQTKRLDKPKPSPSLNAQTQRKHDFKSNVCSWLMMGWN